MDRRGPKSATEGRRSVEGQRDDVAMAAARGGFAAWLRAGRAARQLTVEDVARVTRIQQRALERLESGQFEELPAEVFVRGFVRNYARCVGLDEHEALARYTECGLAPAPASSPQAQALLDSMATLAPDAARSSSPRVLRTRSTGSMPAATPRTTGAYPVVAPRTTGSFPVAAPEEPLAVASSPAVQVPAVEETLADRVALAPAEATSVIAEAIPATAVEAISAVAVEAIPVVTAESIPAVAAEAIPVVAAEAIPAVAPSGHGKGRRRKGGSAEPAATARRGKRGRKGQTITAAPVVAAPVVAAPVVAAPVVAAPVVAGAAPVVAADDSPDASVAAVAPVADPIIAALAPSITPVAAAPTVAAADDDLELEIEVLAGTDLSAPIAVAPLATATTTQPIEIVAVRAPTRPRTSAQMSSPAIVLVIDDADPEQAERAREERGAKEPTRRSFLPPILMDEERSGRQGGLTLAVIILLIVATLTLSYLMRRPSSSGEGVTAREIPARVVA